MKRTLKILFLCCFSIAQAQEEPFCVVFESTEYESLGEVVDAVDQKYFGVFIGNRNSKDSTKLMIDEKGIYFLNSEMQQSDFFFDPDNENHVLYKDEKRYWLFKKKPDDKYSVLYEIMLERKAGLMTKGWFGKTVMTPQNYVDFEAYCESDDIKVKEKKGVVYLETLNEYFFDYFSINKYRYPFNHDSAFDVMIESPDCSPGKAYKWLDSAQYDVLTIDESSKDQKGNEMPKYLEISKEGIFMYNEEDKEDPSFLYKRNDPNYEFQKTKEGYLVFRKNSSGHYDMVLLKFKTKQISFFELEHGSHKFFSLSKNEIVNGLVTYYVCNELEKYLLYGMAEVAVYTGEKTHW